MKNILITIVILFLLYWAYVIYGGSKTGTPAFVPNGTAPIQPNK